MKTEERSRHTVWMEDTVWQRVQEFLEEAKPRLDRERARMADELSEDDLAALSGL